VRVATPSEDENGLESNCRSAAGEETSGCSGTRSRKMSFQGRVVLNRNFSRLQVET